MIDLHLDSLAAELHTLAKLATEVNSTVQHVEGSTFILAAALLDVHKFNVKLRELKVATRPA